MTDGLKDAHREAIIAEIAANGRVERAVLFGSRATGTNTVSSDVDIVLFGDRLTLTDQARLAAALDEIPMAQSVDLILHHSIQDRTLREHIRRQGIAWYERPSTRCSGPATLPSLSAEDVRLSRLCLEDVANITMGQSPRGETVSSRDGVPLLNGPTEFGAHHPHPVQFTTDPRRCAQPGDLLFCVRGSTTGRMNWADRQYAIGRGVAAIRHRQDLGLQPFVQAVIEFELPALLAHATGSTFPNVSGRQLAQIPCPNFAKDEQRAIARILGTLDDKIELNRQMNDTLEAMAQVLFKSWFVDFDPVRAKMEGRDTELPKDIAVLFPNRLVDSELGYIPEGWEVKTLGDLLELAYGKGLPQRKRRPGNTPVYGSNGQVGWHDEQLIDGPGIIVGRKGNPGLVRWSPTGFFPIDTTFYVVPKDNELGLFYLFHLLRAQDLPSIAADSAVPGLNRNLAYMNLGTVPPTAVVDTFSKQAKAISTRQYGLKKESRTLTGLRDTLLPKLISGEIRVPDAEMESVT